MSVQTQGRTPSLANTIYQLLNPIPFGFFVAGLIYDIFYFNSAEVIWYKGASVLITIGLFFAVIPRLINLVCVWMPRGRSVHAAEKIEFLFYLIAIVAAIFNAFVHSRDAFAVMPAGLNLSIVTVVCIALSIIVSAPFYAKKGV